MSAAEGLREIAQELRNVADRLSTVADRLVNEEDEGLLPDRFTVIGPNPRGQWEVTDNERGRVVAQHSDEDLIRKVATRWNEMQR